MVGRIEKPGRYCVSSSFIASGFLPQIAIAIFVLTSNREEANHFGGLDVAPGCYCRVPLKCAMVAGGDDQLVGEWCHCWVALQLRGREGDDQL